MGFTIFFLGCFSGLTAQIPPAVDSVVRHFSDNDRFLGAAAMSVGGKEPVSWYAGYSSIEGRAPVNAQTTFRIGSITKMFTAVMILQLEHEGKLSTSDVLDKYFANFKYGKQTTLMNLLTHSSGLHNFTQDTGYAEIMGLQRTHEEMVDLIRKVGYDFEPGAGVSYSNSGYVLLGYIVEQVSGKPYKIALQERIISPLKMTQTRFGYPGDTPPEEAYSYTYEYAWLPATNTDLSIPHGAGAIVSTPADLCRFIEGLFQGKLIDENQLEKMTKHKPDELGAGMFMYPFYSHVSYGHSGGIDGFVSQLGYFPEDSLAIAICFNGMRSEPNDLALGMLSAYFNTPYTYPDFTVKAVVLSDEQLEKCVGTYVSDNFPLEIFVTKGKMGLKAQATGQSEFPLEAMSETDFRFEAAKIWMEFRPSADGQTMTGMKLTQMGNSYEFKRK